MNSSNQFTSTGELSVTFIEATINEPTVLEHYHESYEIAFFSKADIKVFVKDISYDIKDGDILFINEYDLHRITYSSNTLYLRHVINFTRSYIEPFLNLYALSDILNKLFKLDYKKISTTLKQREEISNLLNTILKLSKRRSAGNDIQMSQALIVSYLFILLSNLEKLIRNTDFLPVSRQNEKNIQAVINFIDNRYMEQISLGEIASSLSLSKFHISHIFKENTGFSLFEYIQYRRIIEAQKMLKDHTSNDISDICYKCGFTNVQHFYRVFKKISKTTPGKFKKAKNEDTLPD